MQFPSAAASAIRVQGDNGEGVGERDRLLQSEADGW